MKRSNLMIPLLLLALHGGAQTVKRISLPEALTMAATGNRQLQIQALEEVRQREVTKETRSRLLPNVAASGSYLRYFDRQVIFLPGSFAGTEKPVQDVAVGGKNAFNGYVSASQPLLNEGARRQTKTAVYDEKIQREKTADLRGNLGTQISIFYYDMLLMQSQIALHQQSLARNEKALKDTRSLFAQGRSLKQDTLRAFIAVENLRTAIAYLQNNLDVAGIQLKRLIGMDDAVTIGLSDTLVAELPAEGAYELESAIATAVQHRPDMAVQKLLTAKSGLELAVAKAERIPQINAVGQYQLQAQADNFRLGQYAWPPTSFVGLQVAVPIFNGNRIKTKVSQAEIRIKQETIGQEDLAQSVRSELASLLSQWKETNEQLRIQQRTVELAGISYTMMDDRYRNGLSTRLELTDAELALTQAKLNYLQAVYYHKVTQVRLRRAQGLLQLP
ncbi:TolC family protein [Chitinophaga qingshengii]|uniref:TolC family protein n=1 Tax=Chitinophaga qingshengii TaxID=1569794 RepID=A0ABR7TQT5_9BACT|nr:TolC family protein [Chitinophaga qingshengii]MBC9931990.1 TolC family protein [Chitinophaga qingshengii]